MSDKLLIINDRESFPDFSSETAGIRNSEWRVSNPVPGNGVTLPVDSVWAAFNLEETLWEQKDDIEELRCDHDGYLFSFIRTFQKFPECVLPDRADMTPNTHFLRFLSKHVASVGRRRGVRVTGDIDEAALQSNDRVEAADLLLVPRGRITERGIRENIRTAVVGEGTAVPLACAQLWQWVHHETGVLDEGRIVTAQLFSSLLDDELGTLGRGEKVTEKAQRLAGIVLDDSFTMQPN